MGWMEFGVDGRGFEMDGDGGWEGRREEVVVSV